MKLERICYWILIFGLIIILINLKYCSGRKPCPTLTKEIHDTIPVPGEPIIVEKPVPVYIKVPVLTPSGIITPTEEIISNIDSSEIVSAYFTLRNYSQKYSFPDGDIIVENEVFQNSLQNQKISPVFRKIETTKTYTDTVEKYIGRNILLFGGGLYGNKESPFTGGILSLSLKTKKDREISFGRMQNFSSGGFWFTEYKIPIHLKN